MIECLKLLFATVPNLNYVSLTSQVLKLSESRFFSQNRSFFHVSGLLVMFHQLNSLKTHSNIKSNVPNQSGSNLFLSRKGPLDALSLNFNFGHAQQIASDFEAGQYIQGLQRISQYSTSSKLRTVIDKRAYVCLSSFFTGS